MPVAVAVAALDTVSCCCYSDSYCDILLTVHCSCYCSCGCCRSCHCVVTVTVTVLVIVTVALQITTIMSCICFVIITVIVVVVVTVWVSVTGRAPVDDTVGFCFQDVLQIASRNYEKVRRADLGTMKNTKRGTWQHTCPCSMLFTMLGSSLLIFDTLDTFESVDTVVTFQISFSMLSFSKDSNAHKSFFTNKETNTHKVRTERHY